MQWRKPRRVRVHTLENGPSVEGVLVGRHAGHYVLANARLYENEERSHVLDGVTWVPRERVLLVQELASNGGPP